MKQMVFDADVFWPPLGYGVFGEPLDYGVFGEPLCYGQLQQFSYLCSLLYHNVSAKKTNR